MFKLTSKLALSNLKQNRKLYYPFALAVILTTMILYSFIALASTPHLEDSYGGGAARTVLGFGSFVVQLVVIILVAYANGYVMKNRSKELGLYSVLGNGEEASPHHDLMGIALLLCSHSWSRTGFGTLV